MHLHDKKTVLYLDKEPHIDIATDSLVIRLFTVLYMTQSQKWQIYLLLNV